MTTPLSALPAANALAGTEVVPVVQDGVTRRTTASALTGAASANLLMDALRVYSADCPADVLAQAAANPYAYVCDGVDDQVEITAALAKASRASRGVGGIGIGRVQLVGPNFTVGQNGGSVLSYEATTLEGCDYGTMVAPLYSSYDSTRGAFMLAATNDAHCMIRNLTIARPGYLLARCHGIRWVGSSAGQDYDFKTGNDQFHEIIGVKVGVMQGRGISVESTREVQYRDCLAWDCTDVGLYLGSSDSRIYDSTAVGNPGGGIHVAGGNGICQGNKVYYTDASTDGFLFTSSRIMAVNNSAQDCGRWGMNCTSANATVVGYLGDSNARTDASGGGLNIASSGVYEGIHCYDRNQTPASPQLVGINIAAAYADLVLTGRVSVPSGSAHVTGSTPAAGSFVRVARSGTSVYSIG